MILIPVLVFFSCGGSAINDVSGGWRMICGDDPSYGSIEADDSDWKTTDLPAKIDPGKGRVVWLRKKITLDPSCMNAPPALYIGKIRQSDRTYFNGVMIGATGSEPPAYNPSWQYERYYLVPRDLTRCGRDNQIAIRIYSDSDAVVSGKPFIAGPEEAREINFYRRFLSEYLVMGLTFLTLFWGLVSLVQFVSNPRERMPLNYFMLTGLIGLISLHYYLPIVHFMSYRTRENIFFALLSLVYFMIYLLIERLLGVKSKIFTAFFLLFLLISVVASLTATESDPIHGWRIAVIVTVGFISNLIWALIIVKSLKKKRGRDTLIITAGFVVFLACMIRDSLASAGFLISGFYLLPVGFQALLVALGIVMSFRASDMMKSQQLKKYLPPQLVDSIIRGGRNVRYENERKNITVFFSDIVAFTDTTEGMEPEELAALLNEYLTEMTRIADSYGGTIDKFIGDAIMIFFGAPEHRGPAECALACARMAIDMQNRMKDLGRSWFDRGIENPFKIRIGINTGTATVGNFGAENRLSYTVIGNQVNLAARLQSICVPGEITISHSTYALIRDSIRCVKKGRVKLKGFHRGILAYGVVPDRQSAR